MNEGWSYIITPVASVSEAEQLTQPDFSQAQPIPFRSDKSMYGQLLRQGLRIERVFVFEHGNEHIMQLKVMHVPVEHGAISV